MKRKKVKPLESILVKPAGPDCNLGCTYCFYLEKTGLFCETRTHRMSDTVLHELVRQAMEQSKKTISFNWQGGEPTLMGLDFFKTAVEYEKIYGRGKIVGNGLQTNGILIDEQWADFLKQYNFLAGLSLDGPEHVHDHYRLTPAGRGTWKQVVKNARLLLQRGVAVNGLCCVTAYSAEFAAEIYKFFKNLGITWMQFIPVVEPDRENPEKAADFSVTAEQYGRFLTEIFDLWRNDFKNNTPSTNVRFIDSILYTYAGLEAPDCHLRKECGVYPTVEHNGDIYACDFFVKPEWKLGNIMENRLADKLNSRKQSGFGRQKGRLPAKCSKCRWYRHCFGGCPKDRIKDPQDNGMPRFCKSTVMFLEHADPVLSELARKYHTE